MVLQTWLLLARAGRNTVKFTPANPMRGMAPGSNPIIRTKQYLEQGIMLRDSIKIMMINYGDYEDKNHLHEGARLAD